MAIAAEAYRLPSEGGFDAPIGAALECLGMRGWLYCDPQIGTKRIFKDSQANSYARHGGGMVGTLWTVIDVQPVVSGMDGCTVTLETVGDGAAVRLRKMQAE